MSEYPQYDFEMPEYLPFYFPLEIDKEIERWPYSTQGYYGGQYPCHTIADELNDHESGSVDERWTKPMFDDEPANALRLVSAASLPPAMYRVGDMDDDYSILILWLMLHHRWHYYHSDTKIDEELYLNVSATVREYERMEGLCAAYWDWGDRDTCGGELIVSHWLRLISCIFEVTRIPRKLRAPRMKRKTTPTKPLPNFFLKKSVKGGTKKT